MAELINPAYDEIVLAKAHEHFKKEDGIQLLDILTHDGLRLFEKLKWKRSYVPLKYSCHSAKVPVVWKLLPELISHIVGQKMKCSVWCIAMLHGDYSVLYDAMKPGKGFAFMLDINDFPESWGGYSVFMKGNKEIVRVVPKRNSLTIVNEKGLKCFHKYVNHHAKYPRIFLYGIAVPK